MHRSHAFMHIMFTGINIFEYKYLTERRVLMLYPEYSTLGVGLVRSVLCLWSVGQVGLGHRKLARRHLWGQYDTVHVEANARQPRDQPTV